MNHNLSSVILYYILRNAFDNNSLRSKLIIDSIIVGISKTQSKRRFLIWSKRMLWDMQVYRSIRRLFTLGIYLCLLHSHTTRATQGGRHNHHPKRIFTTRNHQKQTNIYPRGGASPKQYRDVLQISQKSSLIAKYDDDEIPLNMDEIDYPSDAAYIVSRNRQNKYEEELFKNMDKKTGDDGNRTGFPVIYRYFGRSRARSVRADSVPFIVIGSCVEHWKLVGRILASRGFNCIVVERVKEANTTPAHNAIFDGVNEGEALVTTILDVLKWQRAILVGCDNESILGIEAALRLAPDRIVGLVLCGDLSSFQRHVEKEIANMKLLSDGDEDDFMNIESFLENYLECPCQLVWDGDISSWPSHTANHLASSSVSKIILGGGLAPHRRLPEQFAWALTRFVEEKVSTFPSIKETFPSTMEEEDPSRFPRIRRIRNSWSLAISQIFAPGTLLVSGRILASTIIYLSIAKATMVQYQNFRDIQSSGLNLSKLQIVKIILKNLKRFELNKLFTLHASKVSTSNLEKTQSVDGSVKVEEKNSDNIKSNEESELDNPNKAPTDEETGPKSREDNDDQTGDNLSPLLHKLFFFDQIIS